MNALVAYLLIVLTAIAPHVSAPRRSSIAHDIAVVTLHEERAFEGDESGLQTALLVVSLAHFESGKSWAAWIDDGRCNDPAWRVIHADWLKGGGCDNAKAWGLWQVHAPGDDPALGRRYVRDRKRGIRAALFIARASIKMGIGLCAYSGEKAPRCPLADRRLRTAREWAVRFPFPASSTLAER